MQQLPGRLVRCIRLTFGGHESDNRSLRGPHKQVINTKKFSFPSLLANNGCCMRLNRIDSSRCWAFQIVSGCPIISVVVAVDDMVMDAYTCVVEMSEKSHISL
jgi:hypothetical protein